MSLSLIFYLGGFGEFSSKVQIADPSVPMKLRYFSENNIQIVKVEAGARHSLFLDSEGKVYG
jgi:alpha-tubulin suppressor-like RCC1 family protein